MIKRIDIDDLEYAYLEMHYLLGIFEQVFDSRVSDAQCSDISYLYTLIIKKRDCFYRSFNTFLKLLLKNQ